jgi:cyanophycinase
MSHRSIAATRIQALLAAVFLIGSAACTQRATQAGSGASGSPKVGPPSGTVMVVGGGALGPEIVARFIAAAGGPDALIVDVPTAGGDSVYSATWRGANFLKAGGAKNVVVLHTTDKNVANSDQFIAPLARAGGVWFEGGRQWHLVDSYAGTKTEQAFHDVLARGGVVGGSSAGASILSSYMLRGARSGNEIIMAPGYEVAFGFLRGVAIDQHVVARERLRDLADSLMPRHPELLGISEDEGTAWVVRGDVAEIIGRNKAFVYGGADQTDARKPFLTLYPGDRYDLAARRVVHRASDDSPVTRAFVDSLFRNVGGVATVLVARDGKVLVDQAFGVPDHPRYMPGTTVPNFPLGELSDPINALAAQLAIVDGKLRLDEPLNGSSGITVGEYLLHTQSVPNGAKALSDLVAKRTASGYPQLVTRRIFTPIGMHKTTVDSSAAFASNVDELYRLELGLQSSRTFAGENATSVLRDASLGWRVDQYRGLARWSAFGTADGRRNAFVRIPERRVTIIILTDRDGANAREIADRIAERLAIQ